VCDWVLLRYLAAVIHLPSGDLPHGLLQLPQHALVEHQERLPAATQDDNNINNKEEVQCNLSR